MLSPSPHVTAAVDRVSATEADPLDQAEALVEVAIDLQKKPKTVQDLIDALFLYDQAIALSKDNAFAHARALAGKGVALRRLPGCDAETLENAKGMLDQAMPVLREHGDPDEVAELEMNLGLILHALSGVGKARLPDAVSAYQRALRVFTKDAFPREFAILHNNLATAYLALTLSPERAAVREALAVSSFQEALKVVTLEEDPVEFAMLQSNLGNALQAMRTSHPIANLQRAVEAYDEALKVRTARDMPVEHANTITNKANALMNLPDDPENLDAGNPHNLTEAVQLLASARNLFAEHGVDDRAQMVEQLRAELAAELGAA